VVVTGALAGPVDLETGELIPADVDGFLLGIAP
jgi:hypothetical protein